MHPFTEQFVESIAALGEDALLKLIRDWLGTAAPPPPHGMGDDCAVLPTEAGNLLKVDSLLYSRHFDDEVSPEAAGGKLLKRNLSDIAACGGKPVAAVVALLLPKRTSLKWLEGFCRGLAETALTYGVALVGGDLTETEDVLGGTLTLTGRASKPLLRTGLQAGDSLMVTGALGGSRLGKHHAFLPRLKEGQWLATQPEVVAAMDLSDGLAQDLPRFLPDGLQAQLWPHEIPLASEAMTLSANTGRPPLWHGLSDGEDYELLLAVRCHDAPDVFLRRWERAFPDEPELTCMGKVVTASESSALPCMIFSPELPPDFPPLVGYEHFR